MSERYTKLFSLPENLYAETSPVVIAAGALLKDNATGRVLAQLKFRNITGRVIKALRVSITPLDTMGAPLGEAVSHQYLDLSAGRNEEFGQKVPVALPDAAARSCSVSVAEAIFSDNSLWAASAAPWESLPAPVFLSSVLRDQELEKQYGLKFGGGCRYSPMEHKDLWYCTCGALNTREDPCCHKCHNSLAAFRALDMDALKAERDERLAAEAQKAAEEKAAAEAQAKKAKKLAAIILPIVVAVIAAVVLVIQVILPAVRYSGAEKRLAAGDYDAAIAAFEALGDYKDSADLILESKYLQASEILAEERFDEAASSFKELGGYKESERLWQEASYAYALTLYNTENYSDALTVFNSLGNYIDSQDMVTACQNECNYAEALDYLASNQDDKAFELLTELGDYRDVKDYLADFRCFMTERAYKGSNYTYAEVSNYIYDDQGKLIRIEKTDSSINYSYRINGSLEEIIIDTSVINDYKAEYDEHGNPVFFGWKNTKTGLYGQYWKLEYQYDEDGNIIAISGYHGDSDEDGTIKNWEAELSPGDYIEPEYFIAGQRNEYDYFRTGAMNIIRNGGQVREEYHFWPDSSAVVCEINELDENGNVVRVGETLMDIRYNAKNQLSECVYTITTGTFRKVYTYDNFGNLVRKEWTRDGEQYIIDEFNYEWVYCP